MSDDRKYYYLKLKEGFFESEEMTFLQQMQDGYLYSDILMKMYLKSLKDKGKLMYRNLIPYSPEMLATVCRHKVGVIEKALTVFQNLGLIEILDNGAIFMSDIQNFIGQSSSEADRKRQYRDRIAREKEQIERTAREQPKIEEKKEPESKPAITAYSTEFEELWKVYPRHDEKAGTYKKYQARLKDGFSAEDLMLAAINYANDCRKNHTEKKYIKMGKTFYGESTPFIDYLSKKEDQKKAEVSNDDPFEEWRKQ